MKTNIQINNSGSELESRPEQVSTAQHTARQPAFRHWRAIYFDGPQSDRDWEGEEIPVWCVFLGDDDGNALGKVYWCHDFKVAQTLANRMAHDRRLELINEATAA
jgi:hypothetical protein